MTAEPLPPTPDDETLLAAVENAQGALIELEDLLLARLGQAALDEPGESIPWEQVKAEAGL